MYFGNGLGQDKASIEKAKALFEMAKGVLKGRKDTAAAPPSGGAIIPDTKKRKGGLPSWAIYAGVGAVALGAFYYFFMAGGKQPSRLGGFGRRSRARRGGKVARPTKLFMKSCLKAMARPKRYRTKPLKDPSAVCAWNWLYNMKPATRAAEVRRQKRADARAQAKAARAALRRKGRRMGRRRVHAAAAGIGGPARSFMRRCLRRTMRLQHMKGPQARKRCAWEWETQLSPGARSFYSGSR
jgi:hypothetical protein